MKVFVNKQLEDRKELAQVYWFGDSGQAKAIGIQMKKDESGNIYINPLDEDEEPSARFYETFLLNKNGKMMKL